MEDNCFQQHQIYGRHYFNSTIDITSQDDIHISSFRDSKRWLKTLIRQNKHELC